MRRLAALATLFVLTLPAFADSLHREEYAAPCGVLWPAVKDALANSGKFTARSFDDKNMVAKYSAGTGKKAHEGYVMLAVTPKGCELQLETTFAAMFVGNDVDQVKKQVDLSLAKVKSGTPMTPAVATPAGAAPAASAPASSKPGSAAAASSAGKPAGSKHGGAELSVASDPDGAEIELDRKVVGNTPMTIELEHGEHWVTLRKDGYKLWRRRIKAAGEPIELKADLQPQGEKAHWF